MSDQRRSGDPAGARRPPAVEKARPPARSVDRAPSETDAAPEENGVPVGPEDEPKGHPTTDRFRTEQAHLEAASTNKKRR